MRDLLCGIEPKDFDIATNATPEQVRKVFKASRIIGKRFKLVHIFNRSELIEVATFRAGEEKNNQGELIKDQSGKIIRDNIWGNLDQDTYRRDFTVNALYYCPISKKIIGHKDGIKDINQKKIVSIGDPQHRFSEDPVRSLRAIRFSNKLNFKIDKKIKPGSGIGSSAASSVGAVVGINHLLGNPLKPAATAPPVSPEVATSTETFLFVLFIK